MLELTVPGTASQMKPPEPQPPVVLFDGVCNLCNGAVRFLIARDPSARFRLAALQSEAARRLLGKQPPLESIVLVEAGRTYTKSAAALRIALGLRFPWPLLYAFLLVPRPLRDAVYDWVARHRYGWFGKREVCMVPTPEIRGRFLE
jgi:predicted DCC family thiol-disulfide oxidoreductase YuxK